MKRIKSFLRILKIAVLVVVCFCAGLLVGAYHPRPVLRTITKVVPPQPGRGGMPGTAAGRPGTGGSPGAEGPAPLESPIALAIAATGTVLLIALLAWRSARRTWKCRQQQERDMEVDRLLRPTEGGTTKGAVGSARGG